MKFRVLLLTTATFGMSIAAFCQGTLPAPKITLEAAHVQLFKNGAVDYMGGGGGIPARMTAEYVTSTLAQYANRGFTLVSSSAYSTSAGIEGQFMYMIFQKIDPPAEQEIVKLLDQKIKDAEITIRGDLVKEINNLPSTLDTNKEFLDALYNQIKAEIESRFILIEKTQSVTTLDDYKKKLMDDFIKEFDARYKRK